MAANTNINGPSKPRYSRHHVKLRLKGPKLVPITQFPPRNILTFRPRFQPRNYFTFIQEDPQKLSALDDDENDEHDNPAPPPPMYSRIDPPFLLLTFDPRSAIKPSRTKPQTAVSSPKPSLLVPSAHRWRLRLASGKKAVSSSAFRPKLRCYAPTATLTHVQYLAALDIDEVQSEKEVAGFRRQSAGDC